MALKPRHKRRIFWILLSVICTIGLSMVIVPPMITLNSFRPIVEKAVHEQTNVPLKLNGNIHFSLVGGTTIVAHDVKIPTAKIGSVMFSIPFRSFFDLENAKLKGPVVIYDADITVNKLEPAAFNHNIEIYNSMLTFMDRRFYIVRADFTNGEFHGIIRTKNHKYDVEFIGNTFNIKNKNNNLDITGQMYSDGAIRGHLSVETKNINEWLGIKEPEINKVTSLTTNFEWDGGDGYKFTNLKTDNMSGNIEMLPNGERIIQLVSDNLDFDFSFLANPTKLFHKTKINLDFYGDLSFQNHKFHHLKIDAVGTNNQLQISTIVADNLAITGGTITSDGANNLLITMPFDGHDSMCLFSGTPNNWTCSKFAYHDMHGSISVHDGEFNIYVTSDKKIPSNKDIKQLVSKFGTHGIIHFKFLNAGGKMEITPTKIIPTYDYADNQTLKWLKINIPFLPEFMMTERGDFSWQDNMLTFTPHSKKWKLVTLDNYFYLSGDSFKTWLPNIDLRFISDDSYTISGHYSKDKISNLTLQISGHEFTGSLSGKNLTLFTDILSIDRFINPEFTRKYSEMEFLTNAPLMTLFNLPINVSLYADKMIYNGSEFSNFTYSLKENIQTFSITDASRGNLLATIEREKHSYKIFAQLNKFVINGKLLSSNMPLNIRDTMITAELNLNTYGQIAHDIYYNMNGTLDMTFDGGYLIGMSFDDFYSSVSDITASNAEYAFANTFGGGETKIKKMRIIGDYNNGNFITTKPLVLSMRHTDVIGGLAISDGNMTAEFDITMRGTAPSPTTIALSVLPDGTRNYSLSEIMRTLDIGYMRAFIQANDRF
ncbi:MAG: hypothetical protein IKB59_02425 [Alphaproteobacteria bacterium]|nr:hypothetical protein [Alphaproteobacteria bacterium]